MEFSTALNLIQGSIIVLSGLWVYYRFIREGTHKPRIQFDIDCSVLGPHDKHYVLAINLQAKNLGNIEHSFSKIGLRVRSIDKEDSIEMIQEEIPLLNFPTKDIEVSNIITAKYRLYFVRPAITQTFSYTCSIPDTRKFILIQARFKYSKSKDTHTAERVIQIN